MKTYKKKVLLMPSSYNHKVMEDIEHFADYLKDDFSVYVVYDGQEKVVDGVKYISNYKNKISKYLRLTCDYVIDAGAMNYKTRFLNTQKRISVWHGIPYKKMFLDMDKSKINELLEYNEGIDLMISPCKFYTEEFLRKSMMYNGEILETCVSRTDSLFKTEKEKEEIKEKLGIPKDKKVLLYAPTYRTEGPCNLPFDAGKVLKALNNNNDEWVIVVKLHYLNELKNKSNVIDVTSYPLINELLTISDLVISDYSSLLFDYSIIDKPMIFYQYDKQEYEKDRGFMFKLEDYVDKKYIVTKESDLIKLLKEPLRSNLTKIRKTFYPNQVKNSTEKLVKQLNFDSTNRKTKDIIFLVNELNEIGGIHNFAINFAKEFKKRFNSRVFMFAKKTHSTSNTNHYEFDKENIIDMKLSAEKELDLKAIESILRYTDGYIISLQFGAHRFFQKYMNNKNNILMFHGDTKDIVNKTLYNWHLDALNSSKLYNYKKLLLLTKSNKELLSKKVNNNVKEKLGYIENSFDFSNRKNYYKNNGEFAFISRLDDDKNVFDTIKVFSNKKLNKNFKLHVYGDGKLKDKYEEEIKNNHLEDKIIVHGFNGNKDEIYKDKQGIILTSLSEGFAFVILEAANYGIPFYLYDSFTATNEFKDSKVIHLIKTSNIDEFVKELNKESKFDKNDFDLIVNKFSNDTIILKWLKLFEEIESEKNIEGVSKSKRKADIKRFIKRCIGKAKRILENISSFKKFYDNNKKIVYDIKLYKNYYSYKIKRINKKKYNPLVSIIVPFYNNLSTIESLLKSIKKSGYKNYEILVINDGSKEDPSNICKKYKNTFYYEKENEGPGLTRNYGLNKAKGKYVFFIDSDDTMCKGALNYLVDYAESKKLDVVGGRVRKIKYKKNTIAYWFKKIYSKKYINTRQMRYDLLSDTISTAKIYNLESLKKSNILFESGYFEDNLFIAQIYNYYDNIGIVNRDVYNWITYGNYSSITTNYTIDQMTQRVDKMEKIFNIATDKNKQFYVTHAVNHDVIIFVNNYLNYNEKDRYKIYCLFRDYFNTKKDYIYYADIVKAQKREVIRCILNDDYDRFNTICECISYDYIKTH